MLKKDMKVDTVYTYKNISESDFNLLKSLPGKKTTEDKLTVFHGLFAASRSEQTALTLRSVYDLDENKHVNVLFKVNINKHGIIPA